MNLTCKKGFTLIDVILAGVVISILVVIAFPFVSDFLLLQNEKEEEEIQAKILRMMDVMSEETQAIPVTSDITAFANETQLYGDFLSNKIREDAFRNERYYRGVVGQETFRDATFDVHYAILYSTGTDGCWGDGISCVSSTINTNVTALLGSNPSNYLTNFRNVEAPQGDFLIKFTNRPKQLENYKKTTQRLEKLTNALAEYGQLKRYEGIADGELSTLIYFPPSDGVGTSTQIETMHYANSRNDIDDELAEFTLGDFVENDDAADDATGVKTDRRESMIALTRVLGLPDEYCCNAMNTFIDGSGERQEEAFFYYSNPRARINVFASPADCGPENTDPDDRKLPPRITVEEDPCGK